MPQPKLRARAVAEASLPPAAVRSAIATATHRAVVEAVGPAAAPRSCALYANVGAALAGGVLDREYAVVYGSLTVRVARDPDGAGDAYFQMRADDAATRGMEFHAWIQGQDEAAGVVTEVIDFAARHYRGMYETQAGFGWAEGGADPLAGVVWAEEYPPFVWATPETAPDGLFLSADPGATLAGGEAFFARYGEVAGTIARRASQLVPRLDFGRGC